MKIRTESIIEFDQDDFRSHVDGMPESLRSVLVEGVLSEIYNTDSERLFSAIRYMTNRLIVSTYCGELFIEDKESAELSDRGVMLSDLVIDGIKNDWENLAEWEGELAKISEFILSAKSE